MKKTLVALAVLAASGASFAQVTITGEATWGYRATTTAGSDASGFGVDTSELYFAAVEDIGGGNTVKAAMAIGGLDRGGYGAGGATTGQDFSIAIGGASTGTVKVATNKGADYLPAGSSAAVVSFNVGYDGRVTSARSTSDNITYSVPVGPVALTLGHRETANSLGLGAGSTGNSGQGKNWIAAKGAFGGLTADAGYAVYDNKGVTGTGIDDTSLYAAANYNFGVAKVGFGFENRKKTLGSVNDTYLAASTTFGAVDLGVDFASRKYSSDFAPQADKSGYGLAAVYHVSKRTSLIARTGSFDLGGTSRDTQTDLYIDHQF
jgi:predicted porin